MFYVIFHCTDNFPPNISASDTFRVNISERQSVYKFSVIDDLENLTVVLEKGLPPNASLTHDGMGNFTFRWSLKEPLPMELTFVATDSEGATTLLTPTVEICGCQNGGNCTTLGQDPSVSAYVMSCSCPRGIKIIYTH